MEYRALHLWDCCRPIRIHVCREGPLPDRGRHMVEVHSLAGPTQTPPPAVLSGLENAPPHLCHFPPVRHVAWRKMSHSTKTSQGRLGLHCHPRLGGQHYGLAYSNHGQRNPFLKANRGTVGKQEKSTSYVMLLKGVSRFLEICRWR